MSKHIKGRKDLSKGPIGPLGPAVPVGPVGPVLPTGRAWTVSLASNHTEESAKTYLRARLGHLVQQRL